MKVQRKKLLLYFFSALLNLCLILTIGVNFMTKETVFADEISTYSSEDYNNNIATPF